MLLFFYGFTFYFISPGQWGIEYADCILWRGLKRQLLKMEYGYDIKQHLEARLKFWKFQEWRVTP